MLSVYFRHILWAAEGTHAAKTHRIIPFQPLLTINLQREFKPDWIKMIKHQIVEAEKSSWAIVCKQLHIATTIKLSFHLIQFNIVCNKNKVPLRRIHHFNIQYNNIKHKRKVCNLTLMLCPLNWQLDPSNESFIHCRSAVFLDLFQKQFWTEIISGKTIIDQTKWTRTWDRLPRCNTEKHKKWSFPPK